jgi:hypothetical protein
MTVGEEKVEAATFHERRQSQRYRTDRGVQCWEMGSTVPHWGKLKDISLGGCYVTMEDPFSVATRVRLQIILFGLKLLIEGMVRTSVLGRGMGIEFVNLATEHETMLKAALEKLRS